MDKLDALGFVAGTLTTLAFIPQVYKTWKTGSTEDISLAWLVLFVTGMVLWLAYGFLIGATPVIVANAVTLLLVGIMLAVKLKGGSKNRVP